GLANQSGGTVAVRDSVFTGNTADAGFGGHGDGGGLANEAGATATVTGGTFTGNTAVDRGGGLWNWALSFVAADNGGNATGPAGTVEVRDCTFTGNSAGSSGGGPHNIRTATRVGRALVRHPAPDHGGGVHPPPTRGGPLGEWR